MFFMEKTIEVLAKLLCEAIFCILGEQILPFEQLEHTRRLCKIAKKRNMPHKIKKCPQIVLQVPQWKENNEKAKSWNCRNGIYWTCTY